MTSILCIAAVVAEILWTKPLVDTDRYIGWPSMMRTSKGETIAVYSGDRDQHICPYGKVQMVRSMDNGETWTNPETVCDGPIDDRDAGLLEMPNGDLVLFWFTSVAYCEGDYGKKYKAECEKTTKDVRRSALGSWARRSTDGGRTWSEPVRVPVRTPHGGVLLKDGRILVVGEADGMTVGKLPGDPNMPPKRIAVAESTDGGRSFRLIGEVPRGTFADHWSMSEPTVFESKDGTLTALVRYELDEQGQWQKKTNLLRSESRDGGKTWTPMRRMEIDGFPAHVLRLKDGRLLCSYSNRTPGRVGVYVSFSHDDGKTFDVAHEIKLFASGNNDLGYATTVEYPDGTFLTVYYAHAANGGPAKLFGTKWREARAPDVERAPLRLGVVSDIHLTSPGDEKTFRTALKYFASKNVDAVVLAGDIATLGRVEQLMRCAACWKEVFPEDKGPDGRHVEKLFIYGNHDLISWVWGADAKKQADPAYRATCITPESKGEVWERVFGEKYEPIWIKEVKGYTFIGAHWGEHGFKKFLEARKIKLGKDKPFFLVQHQHPRDTCFGRWAWGHDNGEAAAVLSAYPKAVAISGHSHYSLTDERTIWQGAFTSINAASLEFAGTGYALHENLEEENVFGFRSENRKHVMPRLKTNDSKQGMVVSVWDDRLVIERRNFADGTSLGPDWIVPIPADGTYDYAARAATRSAPEFAPDARATVAVEGNRVTVSFPAARSVNGCRVLSYEATATLVEDDVDLVQAQRRIIAPDYHLAETSEGRPGTCIFDFDEIRPRGHYVFSVRPIECFGKKGAAIVSDAIDLTKCKLSEAK